MPINLSERDGLFQWIGMDGGIPEEGWPISVEKPEPGQRLDYKIQLMAQDLRVSIPAHTGEKRLRISLKLKSTGSLLIRSGGHKAGEADAVHLHRINQRDNSLVPVVSGTSLAGILRNRSLRILNTLSEYTMVEKVRLFINDLFGTEMGNGNDTNPKASRIRTEESVIQDNPKTLRHTRTAIDRWRSGALENMLIQEDALFGGTVTLKWDVLQPSNAEIGLCLCLAKDLFTGDLPVGGESSIGRGILCGLSGTISIPSTSGEPHIIQLQGDGKGNLTVVQDETSTFFEELKQQFFIEEAIAHAA